MRILLSNLVLVASAMLVSSRDMETVYEWKRIDFVGKTVVAKNVDALNSFGQAVQDFIEGIFGIGNNNGTGQHGSGGHPGHFGPGGQPGHTGLGGHPSQPGPGGQPSQPGHIVNDIEFIPTDVDQASDGRVFISILGTKKTPATLATVTDKMGPNGPLVKPYPDWSYFDKDDCNSITNVWRIAIDECQRLWVLDTGYLDDADTRECEPQLLAFDLKTDKLIQRIKIPDRIAEGKNKKTLLVTPIVETKGCQCEDTTIYMADVHGQGMVIWSNGKMWRLEDPYLKPSPNANKVTSGNNTVDWDDGVLGMALSPPNVVNEPRYLFFRPLSSYGVYAVSTDDLKRSNNGPIVGSRGVVNLLSSQAVGMAYSSRHTLFMGLTKESAIACWSAYRNMEPQNIKIIAQDNARLEYVNGMKVVKGARSGDEELWVLSNRLITHVAVGLSSRNYNFRVLKGSVKKLIANTGCEPPPETLSALERMKEADKFVFSG